MKFQFIPIDYDYFDFQGRNYIKIIGRNEGHYKNNLKYYHSALGRAKQQIAKGDEVLKTLTKILRGKEKDQYSEIPSLKDRIEAAKLLGKRYGLFNDKMEVSGKVEHEHQHRGPSLADELISSMFDTENDNASKVS